MSKRNPFYRPEHDPNIMVWVFIAMGVAFVALQVYTIAKEFGIIQ